MVNLLEETKEILERHSKTFDDILFVGDEATHTKMTVKEFLKHANVEYNGGYGIEEINTKLILVGKDFGLNGMSMMVLNGGNISLCLILMIL